MSQNPLLNSRVQDKTTGLKPALVAALSSLEVQLDQELARYRRTQNGYKTPKRGQGQQLTAISSAESIIQPRSAIQPEVSPKEIKTHIPSAPLTQETATPNDQATLALDVNIVPAAATNGKSDHLSSNSEDRTPPEPNGYLESSEALLLSMNEEKPTPQRQTNASDSLLSPLGIGSILLLLMASLSLGYVLFNPKSLEMFKPVSTADTESGQSNTKTVSVPPKLTLIPKYPNLANNELPEVKDADDVVGLKPKPKPTITASFNPVTQESQTPKTSFNPVTPEPTLSLPTLKPPQKPPVVPKKLATEIKPSKDGFYHLVIDDQGEVFASARKVVHDAYKSPDGKLIFLGAAKTKEEAEKTLEELQAQGFKARIQQP